MVVAGEANKVDEEKQQFVVNCCSSEHKEPVNVVKTLEYFLIYIESFKILFIVLGCRGCLGLAYLNEVILFK